MKKRGMKINKKKHVLISIFLLLLVGGSLLLFLAVKPGYLFGKAAAAPSLAAGPVSFDLSQFTQGIKIDGTNIEAITRSFLQSKGIDTNNLKTFHKDCDKTLCSIAFTQVYQNFPVWDSLVVVGINNNKVVWYKSNYDPALYVSTVPSLTQAQATSFAQLALGQPKTPESVLPYIFPYVKKEIKTYHFSYMVNMPLIWKEVYNVTDLTDNLPLAMTYFIDAQDGNILYAFNRVVSATSGNVQGSIYPEHRLQTPEDRPFAHETIQIGESKTSTDEQGNYLLDAAGTLTSELKGPFVNVQNKAQERARYNYIANSWNWKDIDTSYKQEESNVFYHVNLVHDFFTKGEPFDLHQMDYPIDAYVEMDWEYNAQCNAFSTCDSSKNINTPERSFIAFFGSGMMCDSTALGSGTVYHEYTHSLICNLYPQGLGPYKDQPGGLSEGLADYFEATINGNPCSGEYFFKEDYYQKLLNEWPDSSVVKNWPCLRNLDNTKKYPQDYNPEPHIASEVFSASLWDLREALGGDATDHMIIQAMKFLPFSFIEFLDALLTVDDDNQNLKDGTPHISEICQAFAQHGLSSLSCDGYLQEPFIEILKPIGTVVGKHQVPVYGSLISSKEFSIKSYKIEYQPAESGEWSTAGVYLTKNTPQAFNEIIALLSLPSLIGSYTIKLTVFGVNGNQKEIQKKVVFYPDGWSLLGYVSGSYLVTDFEKDGYKEIIIDSHNLWDKKLASVYNNQGELLMAFESVKDYVVTQYNFPLLASGDIDGDGREEVVIQKAPLSPDWSPPPNSQLFIFDPYEKFLYTYDDVPVYATQEILLDDEFAPCQVVLADLDNDSEMELLAQTKNKIWVYHHDGTIFPGWPKELLSDDNKLYRCSPIAVGDMDADGEKEIVLLGGKDPASSFDVASTIYILKSDGSLKENWPIEIPNVQYVFTTPLLIDFNQDGSTELLVISQEKILVYDVKAKLLGQYKIGSNILSVGDLNGDNRPEFVNDEGIYVADSGDIANKAKKTASYNYLFDQYDMLQQPLLADFDGDGQVDVLLFIQTFLIEESINFKNYLLTIFNNQGSLLKKIEFNAGDCIQEYIPLINDINNDQQADLLVMVGGRSLVNIPLAGSVSDIKYGQWGYNNQRTNFIPCVPSCAGKSCGNDGCGSSCGTCPVGQICLNSQCIGLPDLTTKDITLASTGFKVTICNQGTARATGLSSSRFTVNKDSYTYTHQKDTSQIAGNACVSFIPSETKKYLALPGTYTIKFGVDSPSRVTESSESNNILSKNIVVPRKLAATPLKK